MTTTLFKPAGLSVFPRHSDPGADNLVARLLASEPWRARIPWPEGFTGGIAHRLDISTSGAMLVADDPDELLRIRGAFASRAFVKRYRMRAARDVPWSHNEVDRPLAHDRRRKRRMVVQRGPSTPHRGKWLPAVTRFRRLEGRVWDVTMTTGVMHQIRVHAAFIGLVLEGDSVYGGGEPPPDAPSGASFLLHHRGLEGAGFATEPVETPSWALASSDRS